MNTRFEILVEINGVKSYLDTYNLTPISFNYSINEVQDISTTNGGFSKGITIPGTKNNRQALGFIQDISVNTSINPNKKIRCWVFTDSVITIDGYLQIKKVNYNDNQKSYDIEVVIFSDNFNFFKEMGEKYLTDLNINEIDHNWNESNIVFSWTQSYTHGYYYPLIDYGNNWNLDSLSLTYSFTPFTGIYNYISGVRTSDMYPSIYVKYLFDKIFFESGYSYTSNFLNSDKFKNLLIPFSLDSLTQDPQFRSDKMFRVGLSTSATFSGIVDQSIQFNDESSPNFDFNNLWSTSTYTYTQNSSEPFTQRFGMNIDISTDYIPINYNTTGNTFISILLLRSLDINGNTASGWNIGGGETMPVFNGLGAFVLLNSSAQCLITASGPGLNINAQFYTDELDNRDSFHRPLLNGEQVRVKIFASTLTNTTPGILTINDSTFIFNEINQNLVIGQTIDMNRTLPINIKQKDFFQSIVKMFNLYVETDKKNKNNLFIEPRDDFYAGGQIKDWSNKVDFNSIQSYDILANTGDKTYLFKYKDDKDYFNEDYKSKTNETYGQTKWEIDSDFKTSEKRMEVIFSPTPMVLVGGSARLVIPKIYKLNDNAAEKTTSNIRIVTKTTNGLINLQSGGTGSYSDSWTLNGNSYTSYPYVGHFDTPFNPTYDLNFGYLRGLYYSTVDINLGNTSSVYLPSSLTTNNNLVNQYWAKFLSETMDKDSRIVYVNALLDPQDIYDFRFNDSIFIDLDGGGQYFKVNAIKDYNPGVRSLCKLELLKTKNLEINDLEAVISNNSGSNPGPINIHNLGNTVLAPGVIHNGLGNISSGIGNLVNGFGNVTAGPIISVNGFNNISGQGSENMFISGNNNNVGPLAKRGVILGDDNTIESGLTNSYAFGSNITITQSNTTIIQNDIISLSASQINITGTFSFPTNYISTTWTNLTTNLIPNNLLQPGSLYRIDTEETTYKNNGIFLTAITTNELDKKGTIIFLAPGTYQTTTDGFGNVWLGIWQSTLTPSIGDLVIWGGRVWSNVNGLVGASVDEYTLDSEWSAIGRDTFSNGEYIEMFLGCQYDYTNNWIEKQWDGNGNIVGISDDTATNLGITINPTSVTDWNAITLYTLFYGNQVPLGIWNNLSSFGIFINNCRIINNNTIGGGQISYNKMVGGIYQNSNGDNIWYNNKLFGDIYFNSNIGEIGYNSNNGDIYLNSNDGPILNNSNGGNISSNSHIGGINYNSNGLFISNNTGNGSIFLNSNSGEIDGNSCGQIYENSNLGRINTNSNNGDIWNNSNNGYIENNTNSSGIEKNSNNGNINNNANGGSINNNNNIGVITNNTILGDIVNNSNNGSISSNDGTNGGTKIDGNSNSGDISNNSISLDILNNSNNGDITDNSNVGDISTNSNNGFINLNSNNGTISYNSNLGQIDSNSNDDFISYNSNSGVISFNSNIGNIGNNSNTGNIGSNSNTNGISGNTNNGNIESNSNSGLIQGNSNNGDIISNTNGGLISFNSNLGVISTNSNTQKINLNSNNGDISGNDNEISDISNNQNNGAIINNTGSGGPWNIQNNINNGFISGNFIADVDDTIVNKT